MNSEGGSKSKVTNGFKDIPVFMERCYYSGTICIPTMFVYVVHILVQTFVSSRDQRNNYDREESYV